MEDKKTLWKHNLNELSERKALVLDKKTNEVLLEVEYNLREKLIWDEKAKNMYTWFNDDELLKEKTFEVEIKNVSKIVELLLKRDNIDPKFTNLENLIHIHKMDWYKIMCFDQLLNSENIAIDTFKTWLLLTTGLIHLKEFKEANTYIKNNKKWYSDLSEKYIIRI